MKGITCCADCANYSMKKHRCVVGCNDYPDAREHFYLDCPLPDAQLVVRCKECKHWIPGEITEKDDIIPPQCQLQKSSWDAYHADHYCAWGERKEEHHE